MDTSMAVVAADKRTGTNWLITTLPALLKGRQGIKQVNLTPGKQISIVVPEGNIEIPGTPLTSDVVETAFDFFLAGLDSPGQDRARTDLRETGACDVGATCSPYRMRANFFRARGSLNGRLRLLPETVPHYEDLGAPEQLLSAMKTYPSGLILVVGPIGNGKTTILSSMIDSYAQTHHAQITIAENPIEYVFDDAGKLAQITQREVPYDVPTFAAALHSAKRQGSNVVMIGEVRDADTARATIEAIKSGIMVLASSHAASAAEGINTLLGWFPTEAEKKDALGALTASLLGILSPRLLPNKDKAAWVLAYEYLPRDPRLHKALSDATQTGNPADVTTQIAREFKNASSMTGATSLNTHLKRLVEEGSIDAEIAVLAAYDKQGLNELLGQATDWI